VFKLRAEVVHWHYEWLPRPGWRGRVDRLLGRRPWRVLVIDEVRIR
jgi:hypothetical protein